MRRGMVSCARTSSSWEKLMGSKKSQRAVFGGGSQPLRTQREFRPPMTTPTFCAVWYGKVRPEICKIEPNQALIFDEPIAIIRDRFQNERVEVPVHVTIEGMISSLLNFLEARMDQVKDLISDAVLDAIEKVRAFFEKNQRELQLT